MSAYINVTLCCVVSAAKSSSYTRRDTSLGRPVTCSDTMKTESAEADARDTTLAAYTTPAETNTQQTENQTYLSNGAELDFARERQKRAE